MKVAAVPLSEEPPRMRAASVLMQPARLAALQPCRISASRALMVRALREKWKISRLTFDLDEKARGSALYRIETPGWVFDFPVFSFEYSPEGRTGRIIGRSWDMMAALVEGPMSQADIAKTREELPKLYEGRATPRTLIWCRSNRSSRAFNHTLECLAAGRQPDIGTLGQVCYLMRNTGLDGNGTFGTRSFRTLEDNHPLRQALAAQMLCAYMMRVFAEDLVNHLARCRSPQAVPLARSIARYLGVGNGSALGLVLYVNNHPRLVDRWLTAREQALAAAKALPVEKQSPLLARLLSFIDHAIRFRREDHIRYDYLPASERIAKDLDLIREAVGALERMGTVAGRQVPYPLAALCDSLEPQVHAEALEVLHSLMIELVPEIADRLAETLVVDEETVSRPHMKIARLRDILHSNYRWALEMDLANPESRRYVWYKSENAEEPRRGPWEEVEWAFNLGLDVPQLVQALDAAIASRDPQNSTARLLLERPDLRNFITRVQALDGLHYHSPMMNMMGEDFVPIEIVRMMNVAFHGIDKTRDYLRRNLRGVLFHGAPLPDEIAAGASEDWFWPAEPQS